MNRDNYFTCKWSQNAAKYSPIKTPPTNAPDKAKKPGISLPDIKGLIFQVTDENNVKTVCITILMDIQSSQLLILSRKVVDAPEFHRDSNIDSHVVG